MDCRAVPRSSSLGGAPPVRTITLLAAVALSVPALASASSQLPSRPRIAFAPGEVVVVAAPGTFLGAGAGATRARSNALDATLQRLGLARVTRLGAGARAAAR